MITESIFNGDRYLIPLAEVGYIDKLDYQKNGSITVVLLGFRYNEFGIPSNEIYLAKDDAADFMTAWKTYRHEKDGADAKDDQIEKMKNMKLGEVEFFQYDQTQYSLFNYALRVPGGWVYVSTDTNDNPLASTFVPEGQNG